MKNIIDHYDALASRRDHFLAKNKYYHYLNYHEYKYFVPPGKKILEVGCSTGELLNILEPSIGYGVDISKEMISIAREKFPKCFFHHGEITTLKTEEKFDFIILSGLLGELEDIQQFFQDLRKFCKKDTRIIIEYYNYFWQYIVKVGEKLNLKIPQKIQNWTTREDIENFLTLTDYELIHTERSILFPRKIWGISYILNRFIAKMPIINALTLNHFIVARPVLHENREFSVSILVPCKNEKGNIEHALLRTPEFGKSQEFIFVEGGSTDGTYEEIQRVIKEHPRKNIKLFKQENKGKGDAIRSGFAKATGEILMILDADLTVSPEDLPKFYQAIKSDKGEFINGCRLVYPMEKESMRFLNLCANKGFSIFFSWLLGQRFKDTLCGTKVLFKHHYDEITANRHYFGNFDPFGDFDLIFGAQKIHLKIIELPIRYKGRRYGTTQIHRFSHGFMLLKMCIFAMKKIKFRPIGMQEKRKDSEISNELTQGKRHKRFLRYASDNGDPYMTTRATHEVEHGKFLAKGDTERIWGWATAAGRLRAQRRANLIATGARLSPGVRVLEVGCGTGMFTEMFAEYGAYIVAVDISEDLLTKAKERNLPAYKVRFVEKRFEDCDMDGPFDAIIGSSILHHLALPEALPVIFRLLKPNGVMSFAEPNMLNPQVWAERTFSRLFPYVSPDETAFIRCKLKNTLREAGFQNIEIVPFDWLHPSVPRPLIGLVSKMGHMLEKTWFLREFSGSLYIKAVRPQDNARRSSGISP